MALLRSAKNEAADDGMQALVKTLDPISRAYAKASGVERDLILAAAIRRITGRG